MKAIKMFRDRFKQKAETNYLLINTAIEYRTGISDGIFSVEEFKHREDVDTFLANDVAKSERANWKLYIGYPQEVSNHED